MQTTANGIGQPFNSDPGLQVLMEAKTKLDAVVERQFEEAVSRRDMATATRFTRLYKPLGKQVQHEGGQG